MYYVVPVLLLLAADCLGQKGELIAVGGDLKSDRLYNYIAAACKKNPGKLLITTAASFPYSWDCKLYPKKCNEPSESNSKMNAIYYEKKFATVGLGSEWIPCDAANRTAAHSSRWAQRINNGEFCGVFFSGGDQMRYLTTYREKGVTTPVLKALLDRHNNHKMMVAGSSAGTEIQTGKDMITGGVSWWALYDPSHANQNRTDYQLTYNTEGGWNNFRHGILDTHVGQRGRQGRLAVVVWTTKRHRGFGVDQDTALVDDGSNILKIVGDTGVTIVNTINAYAKYRDDNFGLANVTMHYMTDGDSWNTDTNTPIWGRDKKNIKGNEQHEHAQSTDDVFSWNTPLTLVHMGGSLLNSKHSESVCGYSYHDRPTYKVCCYYTHQTQGYYRESKSSPRLISWANMPVDFLSD